MGWWKHVADETKFSDERMAKSNLFESERMFCDVYGLEPGQEQKAHAHPDGDKIYYVVEGEGTFQVGAERQSLKKGSVVFAAAGSEHGVVNTGNGRLALLVFLAPHPRFRKF